MKLCASRAFWLVAYPSQGHEMLFDTRTRAFAALGGVARRGIYDNMKTAVDKVKNGKARIVNARFVVMCAHYLFDPEFCNVACGLGEGHRREKRPGQPPAHLDRGRQTQVEQPGAAQRMARASAAEHCGERSGTPSTSSSAWPRCSNSSATSSCR